MQARELENHVNPAFLPDNNYENHAFYPCFSGGVLGYSGVNNAVFRNPRRVGSRNEGVARADSVLRLDPYSLIISHIHRYKISFTFFKLSFQSQYLK